VLLVTQACKMAINSQVPNETSNVGFTILTSGVLGSC